MDSSCRVDVITRGEYLSKLAVGDLSDEFMNGLLDMVAFHADAFHSREIVESFFVGYYERKGTFVFSVEMLFTFLHKYGFSVSLLGDDPDDPVTVNALDGVKKAGGEEGTSSLDIMRGNVESVMRVFLLSMSTWYHHTTHFPGKIAILWMINARLSLYSSFRCLILLLKRAMRACLSIL
jgi:hypothetical protein